MNAIFAFLAFAALANAGGIPSYSISEIQPDRSIQINRGLSGPLLLSSGLSSKSLGLGLAPLSLSSKSIGLAEPTILSAPLLSKGLSWGSLALAEPEISSKTIITRSEPIITRVSAPLITKTISAPIAYAEPERTLIRSEPLLLKSSSSWGLAEPSLRLSEPLSLGKTIITRSQPILLRSEPQLISKTLLAPQPLLTKSIISGPILSDSLLLGGLGGKLWKK